MHFKFTFFLNTFQEDKLLSPIKVYMHIDLDKEWWIIPLYLIPLIDFFL